MSGIRFSFQREGLPDVAQIDDDLAAILQLGDDASALQLAASDIDRKRAHAVERARERGGDARFAAAVSEAAWVSARSWRCCA